MSGKSVIVGVALQPFMVDTFNSESMQLSVVHDDILFKGTSTANSLDKTTALINDVVRPYNQTLKSFEKSTKQYIFSNTLVDTTSNVLKFTDHQGVLQEFNTLVFQYLYSKLA